jgi:hypothetical protein
MMPAEENAHMGETVACIGMGLLGSALAENLIRADFTVRGYDVAPGRVRESRSCRLATPACLRWQAPYGRPSKTGMLNGGGSISKSSRGSRQCSPLPPVSVRR